jgi:hypothetical protein
MYAQEVESALPSTRLMCAPPRARCRPLVSSQRTTGLSVYHRYAEFLKFSIRNIFEVVTGLKQDVEKKAPAEAAAATAAGVEKRRKAAENRETQAAAKRQKIAAAGGTEAATEEKAQPSIDVSAVVAEAAPASDALAAE